MARTYRDVGHLTLSNQRIASGGRLVTGVVSLAFGIIAIGIYAAQGPSGWTVFASASMLAGAAMLAGGSLGFLFGVPRTLTGDGQPPRASLVGGPVASPAYGANTNLEQISDWLTKILVGVGIAQFSTIRSGAARLFAALGPSLGGQPSSPMFAGALVVYFGLLGFLAGWLLTRLFLAPALSSADRRVLETILAAEVADAEGNTQKAAELRQEALDLLQRAAPAAAAYERLRASSPPGPARTVEMEQLVTGARTRAEQESPRSEEVRKLFDQGNPGSRVYALGLMEGDPRVADFEAVLDAIENSRSAFEQYHAMEVAAKVASGLDKVQGARLADAVQRQRNNGNVQPGDGRWEKSQTILDALQRRDRSAGGRSHHGR